MVRVRVLVVWYFLVVCAHVVVLRPLCQEAPPCQVVEDDSYSSCAIVVVAYCCEVGRGWWGKTSAHETTHPPPSPKPPNQPCPTRWHAGRATSAADHRRCWECAPHASCCQSATEADQARPINHSRAQEMILPFHSPSKPAERGLPAAAEDQSSRPWFLSTPWPLGRRAARAALLSSSLERHS